MRFCRRVTIARPRDVVWRAFSDPAFRSTWDARLAGAEPLSGTPGRAGAITRLVYAMPGHRLVLVETIARRVDPEELVVIQAGESLGGRLHSTFVALPDGRTRWEVAAELHLRGWWCLLHPLVRLVAPRELVRDMHRLRRALETEAGPAAPAMSAFPGDPHRDR